MGLCLGEDGEDEGGGVVGIEGGRYDHVFTRLQHEELHHLTGVHVGLRLGDGLASAEESGWELPLLHLVLYDG